MTKTLVPSLVGAASEWANGEGTDLPFSTND